MWLFGETGSLGNVTDECTEMYILNITWVLVGIVYVVLLILKYYLSVCGGCSIYIIIYSCGYVVTLL